MHTLFKFGSRENGVELYLSSFTLNGIVCAFDTSQPIHIKKFFARDFTHQFLLQDAAHLNTVGALYKFVQDAAEPVLDVVEFNVSAYLTVALHDTVSVNRSGEFTIFMKDWTDAQLPPLFAKLVKDCFPIDVSEVLSKNFNKYVYVSYEEDSFRVFETLEEYEESPERRRGL